MDATQLDALTTALAIAREDCATYESEAKGLIEGLGVHGLVIVPKEAPAGLAISPDKLTAYEQVVERLAVKP